MTERPAKTKRAVRPVRKITAVTVIDTQAPSSVHGKNHFQMVGGSTCSDPP